MVIRTRFGFTCARLAGKSRKNECGIDQRRIALIRIMNRARVRSFVLDSLGSVELPYPWPGNRDFEMRFADEQAQGRLVAILFMSRAKRGSTNRPKPGVGSRLFFAALLGLILGVAGGIAAHGQETDSGQAANEDRLIAW